jgi:white-opaque regulator 2
VWCGWLRAVKHVVIDDLFALNNIAPQYHRREAPPPIPPATQQEVNDFYAFHYAAGLDRLLETQWYTTNGLQHIQSDLQLQDFIAQCAEQFKASADNPTLTASTRSLEARLVWQLISMVRNSTSTPELVDRTYILQALLTGQFLDGSRVPSPPNPKTEPPTREQTFWYNLGRFTSARDDHTTDPILQRDISDSLNEMRSVLNTLENRDVLYSIAIARHYGGRMAGFHPTRRIVAASNNADDPVNKLKIAHQFVEIEDQKGTNQVVQRVCSMALRGWALQKGGWFWS